MKMYSPNGVTVVDCHPTQVENMKRKGWSETAPKPPKPEKKSEEKS